jgi:hypothetical protein
MTTGLSPRFWPMWTRSEPLGSTMVYPAWYTPSDPQVEPKWLSVPLRMTP